MPQGAIQAGPARTDRFNGKGTGGRAMNECHADHRYRKLFESLPLDQEKVGRHACAGCAYDRGYEDGQARKEHLDLALDTLPASQAGSVRHRSPHAAYAQGYLDGIWESYGGRPAQ
jgi:hypothetical protein